MEDDASRDARAAVGDELARREVGEPLVPRGVQGTGDPSGNAVDRVRLAAEARRDARVDDHELGAAPLELLGVDRVAGAGPGREALGLDRLLAAAERAVPAGEVEDGAVVVPEV